MVVGGGGGELGEERNSLGGRNGRKKPGQNGLFNCLFLSALWADTAIGF